MIHYTQMFENDERLKNKTWSHKNPEELLKYGETRHK